MLSRASLVLALATVSLSPGVIRPEIGDLMVCEARLPWSPILDTRHVTTGARAARLANLSTVRRGGARQSHHWFSKSLIYMRAKTNESYRYISKKPANNQQLLRSSAGARLSQLSIKTVG